MNSLKDVYYLMGYEVGLKELESIKKNDVPKKYFTYYLKGFEDAIARERYSTQVEIYSSLAASYYGKKTNKTGKIKKLIVPSKDDER